MAFDKALGDRLDIFIKSLGITQKEFAKNVITSDIFISQIINGHSNLTVKMAYRIAEAYPRLNKEWLLKGEEPMLLPDPANISMVREPQASYTAGSGSPLAELNNYLQNFEDRIQRLEERVQQLESRDDLS